MNLKGLYYNGLNTWAKIKFKLGETLMAASDSILLKAGISDRSLFFANDGKVTLLFAGKPPNFRVLKIIKWLHLSGKFGIILAIHQSSKNSEIPNEQLEGIIYYRNAVHL